MQIYSKRVGERLIGAARMQLAASLAVTQRFELADELRKMVDHRVVAQAIPALAATPLDLEYPSMNQLTQVSTDHGGIHGQALRDAPDVRLSSRPHEHREQLDAGRLRQRAQQVGVEGGIERDSLHVDILVHECANVNIFTDSNDNDDPRGTATELMLGCQAYCPHGAVWSTVPAPQAELCTITTRTRSNSTPAMLATDLDGTLLDSTRCIPARSLDALRHLGDLGIIRVIATGRSEYSARIAVSADLPIDYLVVSSGAGIINWRTGTYMRVTSLSPREAAAAASVLAEHRLDFMVHEPVPNNHRFAYHRASGCADFERRIERYKEHCYEASVGPRWRPACQLLAVHDADREEVEAIARELPQFTVLRATSPLDGQSVWIEVFPATVSKSKACAWIAGLHGIEASAVVAVGNDTNDIDMLRWAGQGVAVANAHPSLLAEFSTVASNDADGFCQAAALFAEDLASSV